MGFTGQCDIENLNVNTAFRHFSVGATDADVAVDGGEWTVEVATEMRAATAAVPSQTQQLAEVSGLRWVGETPPAIAIAECEKAEGARAEGGERKRKREGCGL